MIERARREAEERRRGDEQRKAREEAIAAAEAAGFRFCALGGGGANATRPIDVMKL